MKSLECTRIVPNTNFPTNHLQYTIGVTREKLSRKIIDEFELDGNGDLWVCDKPSTLPVLHPASPNLSNSLIMIVEAQENMTSRSLLPCHHVDKMTSGLTLLCTNPKVAQLIQKRIESGFVTKYYLAKVQGRFPSTKDSIKTLSNELAKWKWSDQEKVMEVDAPVEIVDPSSVICKITPNGKDAKSLFRFISYDAETDTSIILCSPLTEQNHQLRLHLQWLGHPISFDTQYGIEGSGKKANAISGNGETTRRRKRPAGSVIDYCHDFAHSEEDLEEEEEAKDIKKEKERGFEKSSFSAAPIIHGEHQLCLHAWRYIITFHKKKNSNINTNEILERMDFKVKIPPWMPKAEELTDGTAFELPNFSDSGNGQNEEGCIIQ